ncbi:MAG TPA: hypothetical protein VK797_22675 [Tepidisphaeraceae bacterium]|jgi:hypothetical protein|nr:hypothetical protein [Tepidisphaeraceae bacterium]
MTNSGIAPAHVKRERDARGLENDTIYLTEFWAGVNHDGSVTICRQREGESHTELIHIPRRAFARIVEWYHKPQSRAED